MQCKSLLTIVAGMMPAVVFAYPKTQTTTLPLPVNQSMQQGDKSAIDFVVSMPVYQDHVDSTQYYYVPKLKAAVNADGVSATFTKNEVAVSSSSQIADLSLKLSNLTAEEYFNIRKVVTDLQAIIDNAIKWNPNDPNIPVYQNYLNKALERKKLAESNASSFEKSIPGGVLTSLYNNIATFFSSAGIVFPIYNNESISDRQNRLNQKLVDLNSSNGGLITGNIYAGFTAEELVKIKTYKGNYAQNVKISVIPLSSLSFESLTELQYDANGVKSQRAGIPIFSSLKGGGTLTGATFNFDLTTNGAVSFARNLAPFIPPIAVKGVITQQVPAYRATLDCDFGPGLVIKDRSIINKQVAVFNDNSISNLIAQQQGAQQSPCRITVLSGDSNAAQMAGVQAIEKEIAALQVQKSNLSTINKGQYWQQVQQNQTVDRTAQNNGYQNVFQAYQQSGWTNTAAQSLAKRPNPFWQTSATDLTTLTGLKIHKELTGTVSSKIEISVPTAICFVWNVKSRAYRACNEGEQEKSVPLADATQSAKQSQSCQVTQDAVQCGINRNTGAPVSQEGNILPEDL
jgi:hypothetical protein